ncbi:hypothetical protein [Burkholderia sp. ABCPW 11]|uniref:hypothetical protein n=1 Tax=Burkholderia sp. ABCPW 11 TaxID=1637859 RepID=UPI0012FDE6E2|nr:hypothetical protein [Burkholderia sp. ABCPW 11]
MSDIQRRSTEIARRFGINATVFAWSNDSNYQNERLEFFEMTKNPAARRGAAFRMHRNTAGPRTFHVQIVHASMNTIPIYQANRFSVGAIRRIFVLIRPAGLFSAPLLRRPNIRRLICLPLRRDSTRGTGARPFRRRHASRDQACANASSSSFSLAACVR